MNKTTIYFIGDLENRELFEAEASKWLEVDANVNIVNAYRLAECMGEGALDKSKFFTVRLATIDLADVVYVLDGWERDVLAIQEHDYAVRNGKVVIHQNGMVNTVTEDVPTSYIDKMVCLAVMWKYLAELAEKHPDININIAELTREIASRMNTLKTVTITEG